MNKKIIWDNMQTKKFLVFGILICSVTSICIAGGLIVYNAGWLNAEITISDTQQAVYNMQIDGITCPTTITDILNMTSGETIEIQHNIKNLETFALDVTLTVENITTGLNVTLLDGTLNPLTTLVINGLDNKWVVFRYTTDTGLPSDTVLNCQTSVKAIPH